VLATILKMRAYWCGIRHEDTWIKSGKRHAASGYLVTTGIC